MPAERARTKSGGIWECTIQRLARRRMRSGRSAICGGPHQEDR